MRSTFIYRKSRNISGWGYSFDSLIELKYALSIMEDYVFIHSPVSIYYHPGTKQPVHVIRSYCRRYTPDFLVRNRQTGEAMLVEIKPRAFEHEPQLQLRKEVAENYIRWKQYDWKYKVIFDDQIILTEEQLEQFQDCCKLTSRSSFNCWFKEYRKKFLYGIPNSNAEANKANQIHFLYFGQPSQQLSIGFPNNSCIH